VTSVVLSLTTASEPEIVIRLSTSVLSFVSQWRWAWRHVGRDERDMS